MTQKHWAMLTLAVCGAVVAFGPAAGKLLVVNAPEPSDLIVVLAGETEQRPMHALELLDQHYSRKIVLDVPADASVFGSSELELAQKYVQRLPQAQLISICPIHGLSTKEESHDVRLCLDHESGNRILLVTTDFHTRRARQIFRHELPGKTFSVAAAHENAQFGERWWMHRQWAKTCFEEWLRLAWWEAVDRWW